MGKSKERSIDLKEHIIDLLSLERHIHRQQNSPTA